MSRLACTKTIVAQMVSNWTTTPIIFDNMEYETTGVSFVYFAVDFRDSQAVTLGAIGSQSARYRDYGNIEARIFTPVNKGIMQGLEYADTISGIFRGINLQDVVCFEPRIESGQQVKFATSNWWATPVFIPFEYNTIF